MIDIKKTDHSLIEIEVHNTTMILHPYRAVFWPDQSMLIVTDLHLGKIQHFRNAGIYLPKYAAFDNYERLSSLMLEFTPVVLLILGDLFHSQYNHDWLHFCELRNTFHQTEFRLVPGNHDIVDQQLFEKNQVFLHHGGIQLSSFFFSHYPTQAMDEYNIAGHLHPGIRLVGKGLPSLQLPAFYFGKKQGLLPSFGTFTGMSLIGPQPGDQVVVISEGMLIKVDTST